MNKEELVKEVATQTNRTQKEVYQLVSIMVETIQKVVSKGKRVNLVGFGSFETRKKRATIGRNPRTGAKLELPAKTVPVFYPGKRFKDTVRG